MRTIIRAATAADLDAILAIERTSPTAAHWSSAQYQSALRAADRLFLVAESSGSLLGFLVTFLGTQEWELENIAVAPSGRRQGTGRALVEALISAAERAGAVEIRQEIRASNQAAQGLGHKMGFIQHGRRRGYYRDPQEDALLFKYLVGGPSKAQSGDLSKL